MQPEEQDVQVFEDSLTERPVNELVADTLFERKDLASSWLVAEADPTDNPELVADRIATHIRQEFNRTPDLEEVRACLENMKESSIRQLIEGPPWQ
jgi:hypothetical protein